MTETSLHTDTVKKWPPYRQYKPSGVEWLGEVPEGWDTQRLKYSAPLINEKVDGGVSSLTFTGLEHIESWTGKHISPDEMSISDGQVSRFYVGDILFGKLRPYLAKVWRANQEGICTGELLVLKPKSVIQSYLFYFMLSRDFVSVVDSSTYGAKMPRASWEFIGNLLMLIPSLTEQRAIAAFLDSETGRIDALIEKKERLVELLKEKRIALISHTVTKGLDPDAKMKDSGIEWLGEVQEGWKVLSLRRKLRDGAAGIKIGPFGSALKLEYMEESGWKVYGQENVISGDFSVGSRFLGDEKFEELKACEIFPEDILVTMMGTTGRCKIVPQNAKPGIMDSHLLRLRTNEEELLAVYTCLLLDQAQYVKHQISQMGKGSIMHGLNSYIIKNISIVIPSITEQHAIIDFLNRETRKIDKLIDKISESITKLREYRSALISAAVTGKIDVRKEVA